ncbi:hypothetical protein JW988_03030 [Candidatus Bathyarchaeota archaeon]|nr:hypothetical protein [Candidatus Bathyarchaeota archaeon]
MKAFPLVMLVLSISMIFVLNVDLVYSLDQDDFSVSPSWSTVIYYQGDSATVNLIMSSNTSETLTVYYIGIHFDWLDEDSFQGRDLTGDPVEVESGDVHVFNAMAITIPDDVSVGEHEYVIGIQVAEGTSSTVTSWDSRARTMYIQAAEAKVFNELVKNVTAKLGEAYDASYQNSEAQSLLEQAQSEYQQAVGLSYDDQWDEAMEHLQAADSYVDQAAAAEQQSSAQSTDLQRLLMIIGPITAAVVVSLIVIIMWRRRQPPDEEYDDEYAAESGEPVQTEEYTTEE